MRVEDFDFNLPEALIAQSPALQRRDSRLLCVDTRHKQFIDSFFSQFIDKVPAGELLIFNDTRVIKARLKAVKSTGGKLEVLIERILGPHRLLVQIRASHAPKTESILNFEGGFRAKVVARQAEFFELALEPGEDIWQLMERHGSVPLPPYITHPPEGDDEARYQTVYAKHPGAVAAPTAGLHFDELLLAALKQKGVELAYLTLHVGAGTFQPVRVSNLSEHVMHTEWYDIPHSTIQSIEKARARGSKVMAVGTTSLRALESRAVDGALYPGSGQTQLFITPGYRFKVVDRLLTNFHLPRSTLLMLISAFSGSDLIRQTYQHAIEQQYRFFSYGDAMLIDRA